MSPLTLITLAVVLYGIFNKGGYARAIALSGSTAAGSAIVLGSTAIPTFYAVACGAAVGLILHFLVKKPVSIVPEPMPPGAPTLVAFFIWSVAVTVVAPFLFDGLVSVTPVPTQLVAGSITTSNVAQAAYLALGIAVMILVARSPNIKPSIVALSVGTCIILSSWRYVSQLLGIPFPEHVFDNSPSFTFIETAPGGSARFRGILSEPAGLAGISLVTIFYMLPRSIQVTGLRRLGCVALAAIALYLGIISTSTTFIVAGFSTLLIMFAATFFPFLSQKSSWSRAVAVLSCLLVGAAVYALPLLLTFVASTVNRKIASTSYTDRNSTNADALSIFLDTWGFGVGLGSVRASSFIPTLLSATGLVGTLLFVAAVFRVVSGGAKQLEYRPALWALIALLVTKVTAGPDLSDSSGVLWITLGLLSRATIQAHAASILQGELRSQAPRGADVYQTGSS